MNEPVDLNQEPVTDKEATNIEIEIIPEQPSDAPKRKVRVEELTIGNDIIADISQLIHQVNIRRLIVRTEDGYTLFDIPLSAGMVGGAISISLFPLISAIGGVGTLITHLLITRLKIVVEREED